MQNREQFNRRCSRLNAHLSRFKGVLRCEELGIQFSGRIHQARETGPLRPEINSKWSTATFLCALIRNSPPGNMARGSGSLVIPLLLALVVGILLYFYWGVSTQVHSIRADNNALKRELSNARNERDNLQYRLNLMKEDLDMALQGKEELKQRTQEEREKLEEAEEKLVRL